MTAVAHPSATVLVLRETHATGPGGQDSADDSRFQVFMVRRQAAAAFMGGTHVFPGGRVDAGDRGAAADSWCDGVADARRGLRGLDAADAAACRLAAVRELFEETGILLARCARTDAAGDPTGGDPSRRFAHARLAIHAGQTTLRRVAEAGGLRIMLDALLPFAHWVTPGGEGRRFDTRFFVARLPPGQVPHHDATEHDASGWFTPRGAVAAAVTGAIVLPPPTWSVLRHLEQFGTIEDLEAWCRLDRVQRSEPTMLEGTRVLVMPGDSLHPARGLDFVPRETRFEWLDGQWRPLPPPVPDP